MAKPAKKHRMTPEDENIVAAHETIQDAAAKIGKAASALMRRVEDINEELDDLREKHESAVAVAEEKLREAQTRHATEISMLEKQHAAALAAAEKAREKEVAGLRAQFQKREDELTAKAAELEGRLNRHEEKLRKVQLELA